MSEPPIKRRRRPDGGQEIVRNNYLNGDRVPTNSALRASLVGGELLYTGSNTENDVAHPGLIGNSNSLQASNLSVQSSTLNVPVADTVKIPTRQEKDDDDDGSSDGVQQYHCNVCEKDVTEEFRVKCAVCEDYDLCYQCFCAGAESGTHKNNHAYIPIGRNEFPLFSADWNADEEVALVEGVGKYGFGNWAEIANLVSVYTSTGAPVKKKQDCEEHYYNAHIAPFRQPIPRPPEVPVSGPREVILATRSKVHKSIVGPFQPPAPAPILSRGPPGYNCNVVGYMPLRGDFDTEYDNDAELILADLEFRGDETPQERELKMKVVDRLLRKRILIEHGYADWKRLNAVDKRRPKEEADLLNLFRLLVRYDDGSPGSVEELASLYLDERKIMDRLLVLQEWRSLGLRTYDEVAEYEEERAKYLRWAGDAPLREGIDDEEEISPRAKRKPTQGAFLLEAEAAEYPGASLLTAQELSLCDELQLPPLYYLFVKSSVLSSIEGPLSDAKLTVSTLNREGPLYDFVVSAQVTTPSNAPITVPATKVRGASAEDGALDSEDRLQNIAYPNRRGRQRAKYLNSPDTTRDGEESVDCNREIIAKRRRQWEHRYPQSSVEIYKTHARGVHHVANWLFALLTKAVMYNDDEDWELQLALALSKSLVENVANDAPANTALPKTPPSTPSAVTSDQSQETISSGENRTVTSPINALCTVPTRRINLQRRNTAISNKSSQESSHFTTSPTASDLTPSARQPFHYEGDVTGPYEQDSPEKCPRCEDPGTIDSEGNTPQPQPSTTDEEDDFMLALRLQVEEEGGLDLQDQLWTSFKPRHTQEEATKELTVPETLSAESNASPDDIELSTVSGSPAHLHKVVTRKRRRYNKEEDYSGSLVPEQEHEHNVDENELLSADDCFSEASEDLEGGDQPLRNKKPRSAKPADNLTVDQAAEADSDMMLVPTVRRPLAAEDAFYRKVVFDVNHLPEKFKRFRKALKDKDGASKYGAGKSRLKPAQLEKLKFARRFLFSVFIGAKKCLPEDPPWTDFADPTTGPANAFEGVTPVSHRATQIAADPSKPKMLGFDVKRLAYVLQALGISVSSEHQLKCVALLWHRCDCSKTESIDSTRCNEAESAAEEASKIERVSNKFEICASDKAVADDAPFRSRLCRSCWERPYAEIMTDLVIDWDQFCWIFDDCEMRVERGGKVW